jgi:hypothetical protein
LRFSKKSDQAPHDPTRDIKPLPHPTVGHHTWTLEETAAFELMGHKIDKPKYGDVYGLRLRGPQPADN